MMTIAEKLADVTRRIEYAEQRLAEQQERISRSNCDDAAKAGFMFYVSASALRGLRAYRARLEAAHPRS